MAKKKTKVKSIEWDKFMTFVQSALKHGKKVTITVEDKYGCVTTAKFRFETKPEKKKCEKGIVKIPCLIVPPSPFHPKRRKS